MQFPIIIGLRRSCFLDGALIALTGIALAAIVLVPWPRSVSLLLGVATVLTALFAAKALTPRIRTLRLEHDGRIGCRLASGSEFLAVEILGGATAHPWLTVLRLTDGQEIYRVVIAPDSLAPEEFRRLRVWLRWRLEVSAGRDDS